MMGKNSVQLKPTELWADLHAMCSAICSSDVVGVVHIHTGGGGGGGGGGRGKKWGKSTKPILANPRY